MKKATILLLLLITLYACNNSTIEEQKKEKELQDSTIKAQKKEQEKLQEDNDRLLLEKKNDILKHLTEYLPVIEHSLKDEVWGGIKNGTIFIENKTGYDIEKVVVVVQIIKANGSLFNNQYVEFHNLPNGNSQSKPFADQLRGTKVQAFLFTIQSNGLTKGREIKVNDVL